MLNLKHTLNIPMWYLIINIHLCECFKHVLAWFKSLLNQSGHCVYIFLKRKTAKLITGTIL